MSCQAKVEPENIFSYISHGDSQHEQPHSALDSPLPEQWLLDLLNDNPRSHQGQELVTCALQDRNPSALERLMENLEVATEQADNVLHCAVENYDERMWNLVVQRIRCERMFKQFGRSQTTILHTAAVRNIAGVFKGLHDKMGSELQNKLLKTRDGQRQTVLHAAASTSTFGAESLQRCYDTVVEILKIQPELIGVQDRNGETVFHKAVVANQPRVVQHLLTVDATTLRICNKKKESAYGLFIKRRVQKSHIQSRREMDSYRGLPRTDSFNEEIGAILHKAILELDVNIPTMRQLLFKDEPGGTGPELIWDLSWLDNQRTNITAYLHFIESNNLNVRFYETLKSVTLPDLSCNRYQSCDATNHGLRKSSEARVIFGYLKSKGVKHIIEVIVPDCMVHPHANKHIINALQPFNVKRLKWRKLDLGVRTIEMAAPEVESLTLYSSGDKDALFQLINVDGVCQLPKLRTVDITVFRGENDDTELEGIRSHCEEALLSHKIHSQHECSLSVVRHIDSWKIAQIPCGCHQPRFADSHIKVKLESVPLTDQKPDQGLASHQFRARQDTIFDRMLPLKQFINSLDTLRHNSHADRGDLKKIPVKVAVLDSGIYADSKLFPALSGASFIEDITTTDSHWHSASNPHGFEMASLIRKLDPTCHILAARTHHGPDMRGGLVGAAIKALDWAMAYKADIICMSWTCAGDVSEREVGELETKIEEAAKNSLIFCTTGDKGSSAKPSYPAGFANPFSISSCSISGEPSANVEKENTEFYLPAENLDVVLPAYLNMKSNVPENGSSVATALAAGLATLVLTLARFAYHGFKDKSLDPEPVDSDTEVKSDNSDSYSSGRLSPQFQQAEDQVVHLKKRSMMERVFKYMCDGSDKFVQPWEVLPMDLTDKDEEDAKNSVANFLNRASHR